MSGEWTDEQRKNAMTYGICFVCRAPLEAKLTRNGKKFDVAAEPPRPGDGNNYALGCACPNGHDRGRAYA